MSYKSDLEGEDEAIAETVDDTQAHEQSPEEEGENLNEEELDLENDD